MSAITVRADLHVHTSLSKCAKQDADFREYLPMARDAGLDTIGFSNHVWDAGVFPCEHCNYRPQGFYRMMSLKDEIDILSEEEKCGVRILMGAETDTSESGEIGITPAHSDLLDYMLIPFTHYHVTGFTITGQLESAEHAKQLTFERLDKVLAYDAKCPVIIPHFPVVYSGVQPTDCVLSVFTDDDYKTVASKIAKRGFFVEIHPHMFSASDEKFKDDSGFNKLFVRLLSTCKKEGCKFTFGADFHRPYEAAQAKNSYDRLAAFADVCGITDEDIAVIPNRV